MLKLSKIRQQLKVGYLKIFFLQRQKRDIWRSTIGIRKRIKQNPNLKKLKKDKAYLQKSKQFLIDNFEGYKNTNWHQYYSSINGIKKAEYIPDSLFYASIIPTINKLDLFPAYADKTSYDLFFDAKDMPETLFKIYRGRYFNNDNNFWQKEQAIKQLASMKEVLVLKPAIQSGGGKDVVLDDAENIAKKLEDDHNYTEGSFIIQKKINQHPEMAKFHPESVNTCRIMTARVESDIVVLGAYFRIGRNNSKVDNGGLGGLMCSIDKYGNISDYAIDMDAKKYGQHPDTNIRFTDFKIPEYDKVIDFCKKNHQRILRFTLISWDIAIDSKGNPVFIEYNCRRPSVNGHQLLDGPIFGEHTNYFIELYKRKKQTEIFQQTI